MKKLLFSVSFIFGFIVSSSVSAQSLNLHRGSMTAGGEISYSSVKTIPDQGESTTQSLLIISPSFGYFISPNFAFTGQITYAESLSAYDKIGLSAGLKFVQPILNLYIFVDMQSGFGRLRGNNGADDINQFSLIAKGGVLYPFNRYVALETGIKMQYDFNGDAADQMTISFGYFGLSAFF